jgi:hypothetical protein
MQQLILPLMIVLLVLVQSPSRTLSQETCNEAWKFGPKVAVYSWNTELQR